jgi:integrase
MTHLTVCSSQGDNDRCPTVHATLTPLLQNHLAGVKTLPQQDSARGHGGAYFPYALARKHLHAAKARGWQDVFPARHLAVDPCSSLTRRHQVDPSVIHKAIQESVRRAGMAQPISAHTVRHVFAMHLLQRGTNIRPMQHRRGHHHVATTILDTPILPQGGQGVPSPLDDPGVRLSCLVCLA